MNLEEVLVELKSLANENIKKIFLNQGAVEPVWGVKVGDMKTILKKIKNDQGLAMQLYDTGISDAMYLAGLVADGAKMSKTELQNWVEKARWSMLSEYTVPWVASESQYCTELALEWIDSDTDLIITAGWSALGSIAAITPDHELDLDLFKKLLHRVEKSIHQSFNKVPYAMNGFVISIGAYITPLSKEAMEVAKRIGKVSVNMGNTSCKVPYAPQYIQKVMDKGHAGKKRKTVKC